MVFDFVVSAGFRCGISARFNYHLEKLEVTSNARKYYNGADITETGFIFQDIPEDISDQDASLLMADAYYNTVHVKNKKVSYSKVISETADFSLTIGGKVGLRAGIKISLRLPGFGFGRYVYIGFSIEAGSYTELTAYASYQFSKT